MGTVLSRIILPGPERQKQSGLYYHGSGPAACEQGGLVIPAGHAVTFDSYFNGFFYPKYLRYTHVTSVSLRVDIEGQALVGVRVCSPEGERTLCEERLSGEARLSAIDLTALPAEGMLYLAVQAADGPARVLRGRWETDLPPVNDVRVAAVMCTYRREDYVARNLTQLRETVWGDEDCPIREALDLFVVDNGRTLALAEDGHVRLFPNRNLGGSGGFTRGLIEAYRRQDTYTHALFMDDDISFETEALVKTVQLLRYAKPSDRPVCVGGQMLLEDEPTVQFEAGSFYRNGRLEPVGQGLELTAPETLLDNERERRVEYNAWWYCAIPLAAVEKAGLPLPLFIKTDDVEYGLRLGAAFVLMDGIGVWHRRFEQKFSVHLEYYIKRNELVTSALHDSGAGIWPSLYKLILAAGRAALIGDPRAIGFMLRGYRDFLAGPDFFLTMDGEALNAALLAEMKKPARSRPVSILTDPFRVAAMMARVILGYGRAAREYRERMGELTGMEFWERYLGI